MDEGLERGDKSRGRKEKAEFPEEKAESSPHFGGLPFLTDHAEMDFDTPGGWLVRFLHNFLR